MRMHEVFTADTAERCRGEMRRRIGAIVLGSLGNLVEWYDFYAYTAFALYFSAAFFPSRDPVVRQLDAAVLFAAAFLVRPIGGVIFGYLADRYGRRPSLMLSVLWGILYLTGPALNMGFGPLF